MDPELDWYCGGPELPGQLGAVINACAAVATGLARHVLCFRTVYESTAQGGGRRKGASNRIQPLKGEGLRNLHRRGAGAGRALQNLRQRLADALDTLETKITSALAGKDESASLSRSAARHLRTAGDRADFASGGLAKAIDELKTLIGDRDDAKADQNG